MLTTKNNNDDDSDSADTNNKAVLRNVVQAAQLNLLPFDNFFANLIIRALNQTLTRTLVL